jgi:hypothetical protein
MAFVPFVRQLFDNGHVQVASMDAGTADDTAELAETLASLDALRRRQLPSGLPPFDATAAVYGARALYGACQLLTFRDFTEADLAGAIAIPPARPNPVEHFSVDLLMQFLPDVVRLAKAAAPQDPLVARLLELGRRWPLSSVGIANIGRVDASPLKENSALWRLYPDRVLATGDSAQLADSDVRDAIRASIGAYPELAGLLANALAKQNEASFPSSNPPTSS